MMSLQDLLYNWLTIKVVVDARSDDTAAVDTMKMFEELLEKEHGILDPKVKVDETMYYIEVELNGKQKSYSFPRDLIEVMIDQINQEPKKYVNYPDE